MKKKVTSKKTGTEKWKKIRIGRGSNTVGGLCLSTKELDWVEEWMKRTGRAIFPLAIREMIHVAAASRKLKEKK